MREATATSTASTLSAMCSLACAWLSLISASRLRAVTGSALRGQQNSSKRDSSSVSTMQPECGGHIAVQDTLWWHERQCCWHS
jgi:hypothetical protein